MSKWLFTGIILLSALSLAAQNNLPRIELYTAPGLFFEQLNHDPLVPHKQQGVSRLGDDIANGAVIALSPGDKRWMFKGGFAFRQMHYSMAKYTLGDFIASFFLFDAGVGSRDSSALSFVRFTNNYFEVPLSVAYGLSRRRNNYGLPGVTLGLNIRPGFLLKSTPHIEADSSILPLPDARQTAAFKEAYTQGATKTVLTIEPYFELSWFVYDRVGLMWQVRPISFYSSPLNKTFTLATNSGGVTFGLMYDFNR